MKINNEFFISIIQIELMINSLMMNQLENMSWWIGLKDSGMIFQKLHIPNMIYASKERLKNVDKASFDIYMKKLLEFSFRKMVRSFLTKISRISWYL